MTTTQARPLQDDPDDRPRGEGSRPSRPPRAPRRVLSFAWNGFRTTWRQAKGWRELRDTPYGLGPVLVLSAVSFFQTVESAAFGVAAPNIAQSLGINLRGIIGIQQLVGFIVLLTGLFVAWQFDRHERVRWVGLGSILSGGAGMWQSQAQSFGSLAAPRIVDDSSDVLSGTPVASLLADYYPPETRGRVFALYGLSGDFSDLFAIFTAGLLVQWQGWRIASYVLAVPVLVMGIVAFNRLKEPVRGYFERRAMGAPDAVARVEDEPVSLGESWRTVMNSRTLRRSITARIWTRAASSCFAVLFPFFLAEEYGLNAFQRSIVFLPALVVGIAGSYIGGGLIDYYGRRKPANLLLLIAAFQVVQGVGLLWMAFQPPRVLIMLLLCVSYFGSAITGPATNAIYTQVVPPHVRTMSGALQRLARLPALIFFLPLAGALVGTFGYTTAFLTVIPFYFVGAIIDATAAPFFEVDRRNALAAAVAAHENRRARASGRAKLLVARGVDVAYDGVQVLFNVDLDVEEGEMLALLGTNGAGKSTLLRAISGTQAASSGAIVFDGRDITHMPPHEIAARGVTGMPGGRGVFPGLTVEENLQLGLWLVDSPDEARRRLREVLELFPVLAERAGEPATRLSGGEQQMLSLAQAFLCRPRLLLIDELSLGLSPAVVGQLIEVVKEINRRGVTVIVVEQSVNVALAIADRAVFMEKGEVRFDGRTRDLLQRPDILRAVYLKGTSGLTDGAPRAPRADAGERRAVLEATGLVKRFGGISALIDVDLTLNEGECLGIIGPNGSGKTTLFDIISGYQAPDAGRVSYDGVDITGTTPDERARRGLVRRFQDARMFGSLTVFETLLVALEQKLEVRSTFLHAFGLPQARHAERRLRARAERLVELLDLDAYRDKFVNELSTGLRRIVDLACVIAAEPRVLLLDEPSTGIAQSEAESLGPLLQRVRHETGCSMLIIEHDIPLISAVADELIAMDQGSVLVRGPAATVLEDERVVESYLGISDAAVRRSGRRK